MLIRHNVSCCHSDRFIVPSATITPSSSANSNLSQSPVPKWLAEIHQKLWGRRDLVGQIFRKVNLTKTDFGELQDRLQNFNPSRSSASYIPMDIFAAKSEFLRSKSFVDEDTTTYFTTCDPASDGNLVPQPVVDMSKDVTPPNFMTADIEAFDVGTNAMDDAMDVDADYDSGTSLRLMLIRDTFLKVPLRFSHAPFGI